MKERPSIYGAMPEQVIEPPPQPVQEEETTATPEAPAPSLIDRIKAALWLTPPARPAGEPRAQYTIRPQTRAGQQSAATPETSSSLQASATSKDVLMAYLCWICLGCHYLYLGKMRTQVIFWLTLGGCGLWWIIDGFSLPGMVKDYNLDLVLDNVLQSRDKVSCEEPKDIIIEKRSPDGRSEFK